MSQRDFMRAFDAAASRAFQAAGIADGALYYATPETPVGQPCTVLVDRDVRDFDDAEQMLPVPASYTLISFELREVSPAKGGVVELLASGERYRLQKPIRADESRSRWVVIHAKQ
ncbi:hypothetical protein [Luteimonas sp. FCS-9]|uniref:head-tail joining protein n=1 Tax=Luteimonas sp. FCS-9 TaxID=1547516 RepID=UPI00063ED073|nr:hypothetical protein [Luteimonas sp. FCS-9]KLJ02823.1 hypothetical protein WQ56_00605 [Luteimonas sp. FCS-9]